MTIPQPTRLARYAPPRVDGYSHEEARDRRRKCLGVNFDERFDLAAEVRAVCAPLAVAVSEIYGHRLRLSDKDGSPALLTEVQAVADAVHGVHGRAVELLAAGRPSGALCERLRGLAIAAGPVVDRAALPDGAWVARLAGHVGPLAADLADLFKLQRRTAGVVSMPSREIVDVLNLVDRAVGRGLARVERVRSWLGYVDTVPAAAAAAAGDREAARSAAVLDRLGLS